MKRTKWIVTLVLALGASFALCACDPDDPNTDQTPPDGDDTTISTPGTDGNDGNDVDDVDGNAALFAAALESVKTTFKATGSYLYEEETEDDEETEEDETDYYSTVNKVVTIFGDGVLYQLETDETGDTVYYSDLYVDDDGVVAAVQRTVNNEVNLIKSAKNELYADFDNPFKWLTADDFEATKESNVFALTDLAKMKKAAMPITGWKEDIKTFTVSFAEGKITQIDIETLYMDVAIALPGVMYKSAYTFTLSEWGTAAVDSSLYAPYERDEEAHSALEAALAAMAEMQNYTYQVLDVEEGGEDVLFNTYVTENAIYEACEGYWGGYVQSEGKVYPFSYNPASEEVKLTDATVFPTIISMRANFNGFAAELFEYQGEGVYVLRDNSLAGDVLCNFADGLDNFKLYSDYTSNVKVTIKDGKLYKLEFDYEVYGSISASRTLTYSDFNTTEMPISFENVVKTSVLDAFVGIYSDGTHTAVITVENGIVIDGEAFEVSQYYKDEAAFVGKWKDEAYVVQRLSLRQIVVYENVEEPTVFYTLNMTEYEPVEIPEEYLGVWTYTDEKTQEVTDTVIITADTVTYNGEALTVLSYSEDEGLIAVKGDLTYSIYYSAADDENPERLIVVVIQDGDWIDIFGVVRSNDIVIPSLFVGTWEGTDNMGTNYKAVITQTGVEVTFGSTKKTATVDKVEYDEEYQYYTLTVTIDEVEYTFEEYYSNLLFSGGSVNVTLRKTEGGDDPEPSGDIPASYYGTYEGEKDNVTYKVTISADGILVKIGDADEVEAVFVSYDDYWDAMTITINGEEYGIATNYEDDTKIDFSNSDFSIYVTLSPVGNSGPTIPEKFYGTYEGTKNDTDYQIIISADGIQVKIGTAAAVDAVIVEIDEDEVFTLTVGTDTYLLMQYGYDETFDAIVFATSDYSLYMSLNRVAGTTPEPSNGIPEKFYGMYMSEDEAYLIMIDEDGIMISIDNEDAEVVITDYDDCEGFTLTVNGEEYYLTQNGYTDEVNAIQLMSSDYRTVNVTLNRTE